LASLAQQNTYSVSLFFTSPYGRCSSPQYIHSVAGSAGVRSCGSIVRAVPQSCQLQSAPRSCNVVPSASLGEKLLRSSLSVFLGWKP
jgi:hypothetical protein